MASDDESTDPGYRSRSQSRRARRKKQTNQKKQQMPSIQEQQQQQQSAQARASANAESRNEKGQTQSETQLVENLPNQSKPGAMQPFEWIGPDSTSMNGPVTYAKAMRGEIPMRPGNPEQSLETGYKPGQEGKKSGESDLMDQEGLKLRIELNIDIEIELKARIHGDLTLALLGDIGESLSGVGKAVGKGVAGLGDTVGKSLSGVTNTVGKTLGGVTNTVSKTTKSLGSLG